MAIDKLYLDTSLRIQRNYNHNTFNMDQKTSYRKINDALVQLNSLIFDIPEPPSCPLTPEDLSPLILPTRRYVDTAGMTLNASILSIGTIRFYTCKAKRDPYYADFGHVTLDEIDRLIEEYQEEKRARALQIQINMIQDGLPDTESDEV